MNYSHQPVLLAHVIEALMPALKKKEAVFVDGTIGLAGHSIALSLKLKGERKKVKVIGIDKDQEALNIAKEKIVQAGLKKYFELVHDDFHGYPEIIKNLGIEKVDGVLLDLGVSSMQLDDKSRGFSFNEPEARLDMRMDQSQRLDATYIVNNYTQKELERTLRDGEEKHWKKVARNICEGRKTKPINTVGDLISILARTLPKKYSKTHFATDTFRALRLEVNNEISSLAKTIDEMVASLKSAGRLAIITFHSLEDRIVKNEFRHLANPCTCPPKLPYCVCGLIPSVKILAKKPIVANPEEIATNPRSRSAKLRVLQKL